MMGPSSLSVGLWRRRLEKVPQGSVLCRNVNNKPQIKYIAPHIHTAMET
jgi:hypothetical protein